MIDLTTLDWSKCELPRLPKYNDADFGGAQLELRVVEFVARKSLAIGAARWELYWLTDSGWTLECEAFEGEMPSRELLRALDAATVIVDKFIEENSKVESCQPG